MTQDDAAGAGAGGGPLAGVRILDLTAVVMGPYATQVLADLGADVVKVESPAGDNMRAVGPMRNPGMGHLYLHLNRNKRSIVLDLKQPAARDACLALARDCDAVLYNIRPQAMARLGLDYAAFAAQRPGIVYAGAYGYAEGGPYAGRPAYDDLIQGQTGIADLFRRQSQDEPRYAPLTLADRAVGLHVAIALLAAVLHARATGQGQSLEVPMFEGMAHMVLGDHLGGWTFDPPLGETGYARLLAPHRKPYATRDGHVCLLIYNDKHWRNFFQAIGQPGMAADPRFATHTARAEHIGEVYAYVAQVMLTRDTEDWLRLLAAADIPASRLYGIEDLVADPHLRATGFVRTVEHPTEGRLRTPAPLGRFDGTPTALRRPAPRLGEHSIEVLREAGYAEPAIQALLDAQATYDGKR
ncbi:acetyl-CoA acetyltransferase [Bordetella sp. H567]|uniref:CaiB/BaiF CoA transferase family protein n=1 Tax=Bordetella sp. H567 TaxID=1697043 RepID=UPI00081CBA07|nr:CoA transferase [Bordetella sp. H567]AOB32917.1 acetyl-CoA acetyltransferase [Bordetella sp. H567]